MNLISTIMMLIAMTVAIIIGVYVIARVYFKYIDFCKEWGNGTFETDLVSGSWERINCTAWNHGDIKLLGHYDTCNTTNIVGNVWSR